MQNERGGKRKRQNFTDSSQVLGLALKLKNECGAPNCFSSWSLCNTTEEPSCKNRFWRKSEVCPPCPASFIEISLSVSTVSYPGYLQHWDIPHHLEKEKTPAHQHMHTTKTISCHGNFHVQLLSASVCVYPHICQTECMLFNGMKTGGQSKLVGGASKSKDKKNNSKKK